MKRTLISMALALAACTMQAAEPAVFVKTLTFPEDATPEQKVEMASRLVPSQKQLDWQKLGMTAFLHFGVNTFTDREWGDGNEDPAIFNPSDLDADQLVKTLKDAGFKLVILTAKHHDGFCLWPTETTDHSVKSSPWRGGKGDVMADLRKACDKYGMKLGVYLSPWDRNAKCYGDSPKYNDMFVAQLTELLTRYGKIDEVWFDGACGEGPNGKKQEYDWVRFKNVIEKLQPGAVVAIMGDDVRWVGNEKGMGRETEWSATAVTPGILPDAGKYNAELGISGTAPDLGSREIVKKARKLHWWPSEVDVSIRPGWFYHDKEQPKSLRQLAEIYLTSVGRNSVLLLNIPPDRRGRIADVDVERLAEFKKWIDDNFTRNLALAPKNLTAAMRGGRASINAVVLGEDLSRGQRVEEFDVEALIPGQGWTKVAEGTTIGFKRILTFPEVEAEAVRLDVKSSRGESFVNTLGAYRISLPAEVNATLPGYRDLERSRITPTGNQTPACVTVDMGRVVPVAGFTYMPPAADNRPGTAFHYKLELSADGTSWTPAEVSGEFSNIMHNPLQQRIYLPASVSARYFRFTALDGINGEAPAVAPAELGIIVPDSFKADVDDETLVWPDPAAPLHLLPGQNHPTVEGWRFYTAHEFNGNDGKTGLPAGWRLRNTAHISRSAFITPECFESRDGYLRMTSARLNDSIDNGYGRKVMHQSYACNTASPADDDHWCTFTENMRIEVRARLTPTVGLNDALWFMGYNDRPWPANGEIDLLENPKKKPNHRAHFTLHSENYYAGVVGGKGSTTASTDLSDMGQWNIYWMEWYPDKIVGGVNGHTFFTHNRGDGGNNDWPWSDPEGFYMIFTSGLSTNPGAWPGAVQSEKWNAAEPPHMDVDWVRVFTTPDATLPTPRTRFY